MREQLFCCDRCSTELRQYLPENSDGLPQGCEVIRDVSGLVLDLCRTCVTGFRRLQTENNAALRDAVFTWMGTTGAFARNYGLDKVTISLPETD